MARLSALALLPAIVLALHAQPALASAGGVSYMVLYAYIPDNTHSTTSGFSLGEPGFENIGGQVSEYLSMVSTPYYECMVVKWSIPEGMERYRVAPLGTGPTSLYNYTHPVVQRLIKTELSRLGLDKYNMSERMRKIADYVYSHYKYRVGDYPHYPWETIKLGYGDCDDLAILVVTLARAYGIPSVMATGLLVIPGYSSVLKSGGLEYHIEGVAGHAWIVYQDESGEPRVMDRLVPLDTVPDERRIVLSYPLNGYSYVNQTREETRENGGSVYIVLYNKSRCPSPRELEAMGHTVGGSVKVDVSQAEMTAFLAGFTLTLAAFTVYIYRSITRPVWSRW